MSKIVQRKARNRNRSWRSNMSRSMNISWGRIRGREGTVAGV